MNATPQDARAPLAHRAAASDGLPLAPALLGLPVGILFGDELILLQLKPSLWFIPLTSGRFVLAAVLSGTLSLRLGSETLDPQFVTALVLLACLVRLIWALLVWTSHTYLLTSHRIVTIQGVLNVTIYQAPLKKIQRTLLLEPLILRPLGLGTLGFATAGSAPLESLWLMIAHPREVQKRILQAIHQRGG